MRTLYYTDKESEDRLMVSSGVVAQTSSVVTKLKNRQGRPKKVVPSQEVEVNLNKDTKGDKKMAPSNTKRIQRTVFDLTAFDDVKLVKDVPLPAKPASLEQALEAVGNDKEKLLAVIYEGLVADATDSASEQIEGFKVVNEDGTAGEDYTGKFADEAKGTLINAAILSLAKMQGYDKSLPKEKKRELKDKATEFLRSNPAMLASIQG